MNNTLTLDGIYAKMENQVKRILKHYKDDFYHWDVDTLKQINSNHDKTAMLWVIRESGTHFFDANNTDFLLAIGANWKKYKVYLVSYDGLFFSFKLIENHK